jgi:glycosyltransferase involved in cell wall biosynthesis
MPGMATEPIVSLIVTTYQMPRHLEKVLATVAQQTVARQMEVIVADDGSTDETPEIVAAFAQRMPFPVRFVTQPHDGFRLARCRNIGAAAATSPHLVFLDGDCLIPPDHVEQHLQGHRPGVVTNTYCVRVDEPTSARITLDLVNSRQYLNLIPPRELRTLAAINRKAWFYTWIRHPKKPALRGGNVGIRRADYLRVNGYDENFRGWGCEDDDMGNRLRAAGLRIEYILHRTRTFHLWHPPAVTKPNKMRDGQNFDYLVRPLRLTRCIRGVVERSPRDLTARLTGSAADSSAVGRFLASRSLIVELEPNVRTDLELLFWPGHGRFSGSGDCRVLVVLDESNLSSRIPKQADMVLSPSGTLGLPNQVRLKLDDLASLTQTLGWPAPSPAKRKAA